MHWEGVEIWLLYSYIPYEHDLDVTWILYLLVPNLGGELKCVFLGGEANVLSSPRCQITQAKLGYPKV